MPQKLTMLYTREQVSGAGNFLGKKSLYIGKGGILVSYLPSKTVAMLFLS